MAGDLNGILAGVGVGRGVEYGDGVVDPDEDEIPGVLVDLYHLQTLHQHKATKEEVMETLGIATLVGGTIVIPHLRRAYEFWEALEQQG